MTKYRIVETYRYSTPNFPTPTYVIEKYVPKVNKDSLDYWEVVTLDSGRLYYINYQETVKYLEKIEQLHENCKKEDKVLLEKEI